MLHPPPAQMIARTVPGNKVRGRGSFIFSWMLKKADRLSEKM
jgi:hypothetical protein